MKKTAIVFAISICAALSMQASDRIELLLDGLEKKMAKGDDMTRWDVERVEKILAYVSSSYPEYRDRAEKLESVLESGERAMKNPEEGEGISSSPPFPPVEGNFGEGEPNGNASHSSAESDYGDGRDAFPSVDFTAEKPRDENVGDSDEEDVSETDAGLDMKRFLEEFDPTEGDDLSEKSVKALYEMKKFYLEYVPDGVSAYEFLENERVIEKIRRAAERRKAASVVDKILSGGKTASDVKLPGRFVKYGKGQYDWAYVLKNGDVYDLLGVDPETGNFRYEKAEGVIGRYRKGWISFKKSGNPDETGERILSLGKLRAYPFAKYGDPGENGFDWIFCTSDGKAYKLEGYDELDEGFHYTKLEDLECEEVSGRMRLYLPSGLPGRR